MYSKTRAHCFIPSGAMGTDASLQKEVPKEPVGLESLLRVLHLLAVKDLFCSLQRHLSTALAARFLLVCLQTEGGFVMLALVVLAAEIALPSGVVDWLVCRLLSGVLPCSRACSQ